MTTILVAEDSDELAEVIGRELGAAGYVVVRAANGPAALTLHGREQPSLIVLDWMRLLDEAVQHARAARPHPRPAPA
jgi:CheY-like chemotaxis protein